MGMIIIDCFLLLMMGFGTVCIGYNALATDGWDRFASVAFFLLGNLFILAIVLKDFMGIL